MIHNSQKVETTQASISGHNMVYIYTMEYYAAIKINVALLNEP